jgi:hypothetical protein
MTEQERIDDLFSTLLLGREALDNLSACCDATIDDMGLCAQCKEHAE